jgi:hypothetical protein
LISDLFVPTYIGFWGTILTFHRDPVFFTPGSFVSFPASVIGFFLRFVYGSFL